ncbi:MAG: caspase family protein [Rubrivivax sp.]
MQFVFLAALLGAGMATPAKAATLDGPRVALVIGNSAYLKDPLPNPLNDARAIGTSLRQLGFKVIALENASHKQMNDAVRQFGDSLKGGVGLFYYAGHGVQVKGRNYLLPVDADITREDEVPYKAFDVGQVLDKLESAKNPLNIVILDACRNNPFARQSRSGGGGGLAQMDAPAGSIIAFATAPGAEAADGSTSNGLYTGQLLRYMNTPGLKVEDVFKRTRVAVKQASGGRQIPWESTSLEGDFYFAPGAGAAASPAAANLDDELWQLVGEAGHPSAYRAYLEKFPNGKYAVQARALSVQPAPVAASTSRVSPAQPPREGAPAPGGFSFSAEEAKMDRATPAGRDLAFQQALVALNCPPARRNASVRVALDEPRDGGFAMALGQRLQQAGLKLAAAGEYVVQGTVSIQAQQHRVLLVNEVTVNAAVVLSTAQGRQMTSSIVRAESYAGGDVSAVVAELLQAQASQVATQVVTRLCQP